jgi:hypothetical protein
MKTSELTGAALDWAVAKCEGYTDYCGATDKMLPPRKDYGWVQLFDLNYSTDWAQGGPIIEREKLDLWWCKGNQFYTSTHQDGTTVEDGPTPLIAAMRCYVASKLGDDIDVPKELL